jgi:hypothetical protein
MEVYIHLYHFISSGEWRFIFVFGSGKDEYKPPFPT